MIEITIPDIPPSVNSYWKTARNRNTGRPTRYLSKQAKAWKELVHKVCRRNILKGRLQMDVIVYLPDNKRRDVDNYGKSICDSFEGIFYEDDKQIWDLRIRKDLNGKPRTVVRIKKITDQTRQDEAGCEEESE